MKRLWTILLVMCMTALPLVAADKDKEKEEERLQDAGTVLKEVLDIPDSIPQELLDKAECVIVLPSVKKGAIGLGGSYGRGAMTCRSGKNFTGSFGAPSMYALEEFNIGLQLGGQATDFLILVMNPRGAQSLLKSQVKLGGDASVAAGPKGRTATGSTDAFMRAEMLSYSRSRGLFAGLSLAGSTLRADNRANEKLYGHKVSATDIVRNGRVGTPGAASQLISTLNSRSPRNKSDPKSLK
jgi:lipid-binding SYLF domain-containing protein